MSLKTQTNENKNLPLKGIIGPQFLLSPPLCLGKTLLDMTPNHALKAQGQRTGRLSSNGSQKKLSPLPALTSSAVAALTGSRLTQWMVNHPLTGRDWVVSFLSLL